MGALVGLAIGDNVSCFREQWEPWWAEQKGITFLVSGNNGSLGGLSNRG